MRDEGPDEGSDKGPDQRPDEVPPWGTPDGPEPAPTRVRPAPAAPPAWDPTALLPAGSTTGISTTSLSTTSSDPITMSGGDPAGSGAQPDYGTPPAPKPRRARHSASRSGLSLAAARLLDADPVVVLPRTGSPSGAGYDLTTSARTPIGSVNRNTSGAGRLRGVLPASCQLLDADGKLVAVMRRPGSLGSRLRFSVADRTGDRIGTIEQDDADHGPQFRIVTADGLVIRLIGNPAGGEAGDPAGPDWRLVDGLDSSVLIGQVSHDFLGPRGLPAIQGGFAVRLSAQLVGAARVLALMATTSLGYARR